MNGGLGSEERGVWSNGHLVLSPTLSKACRRVARVGLVRWPIRPFLLSQAQGCFAVRAGHKFSVAQGTRHAKFASPEPYRGRGARYQTHPESLIKPLSLCADLATWGLDFEIEIG